MALDGRLDDSLHELDMINSDLLGHQNQIARLRRQTRQGISFQKIRNAAAQPKVDPRHVAATERRPSSNRCLSHGRHISGGKFGGTLVTNLPLVVALDFNTVDKRFY